MIRKKSLNSLNHWFDPRFNMIEEYDFFVRLGYKWELAYVDEVLAKWRVHKDSWTWTKSELFPVERKLLLKKLPDEIPDFENKYTTEIRYVNRICALEEAKCALKKHCNEEARRLLKPYRDQGLKWRAVYWMTWLPYKIVEMLFSFRK